MQQTMRQMMRFGVAAAAIAAYVKARSRFVRWGATDAELAQALPGDDLLVSPKLTSTRSITIEAPPASVWPWLVQMGQDRAGLYSYDWLENLVGLHFHNADTIVPEWQALEIGDQFRAAPQSAGPDAGFTVVELDPGRAIVTVVGDPARVLSLASYPPMPDGATWVFVIEEIGDDRCRLIVRFRLRIGSPAPAAWLVHRIIEPIHFLMERKQLLGIKERAERAHRTATR